MAKRRVEVLSHDRLVSLLDYDADSGFFFWRQSLSNRGVVGEIAGCIAPTRYRLIGIDGNLYYAHRLAWFYVHKRWPPEHIDHINLNPDDNRIANLREATPAENGANKLALRGKKGVHFCRARNKWQASIKVRGDRKYLGRFETEEEAAMAYDRAAIRYIGEYARVNNPEAFKDAL